MGRPWLPYKYKDIPTSLQVKCRSCNTTVSSALEGKETFQSNFGTCIIVRTRGLLSLGRKRRDAVIFAFRDTTYGEFESAENSGESQELWCPVCKDVLGYVLGDSNRDPTHDKKTIIFNDRVGRTRPSYYSFVSSSMSVV